MTPEELTQRVARIRQELEEAADGKYPAPRLIAVTKTHSAEEILPLAQAGVTEIGENRVQELTGKLPGLQDRFRVHLIGRLQRNKVKQIIGDVCMIQSVDTEPLATEIHNETEAFLKRIAPLEGLEIRGLMAVMPLTEDREYLDGLFARMRGLFDRLREKDLNGAAMEELSMGMSGDYRLAAAHGATMVRVGSAIFGPRG